MVAAPSSRPPPFTTQRATVVLVTVVILFGLLPALFFATWLFAYALFVLTTAVVVRSVPQEPGRWLGRRAIRRGVVGLIGLTCVGLLISADGGGGGIPLLILLGLLDVVLGRATERLASAPDDEVDEREEVTRNRAHRLAYLLLTAAVLSVLLGGELVSTESEAWLATATHGGAMVVFFELLFFLPSMVLAWTETDRLKAEAAERRPQAGRAVIASAMLAVATATPFVLALGIAILPTRTSAYSVSRGGASGSECRYFGAQAVVGAGMGGTLPLSALVCWSGASAFEVWGLNDSDCNLESAAFAEVILRRCSRTTDSAGTLHFEYAATVQSTVVPFIRRDVTIELVVRADGRVLRFP